MTDRESNPPSRDGWHGGLRSEEGAERVLDSSPPGAARARLLRRRITLSFSAPALELPSETGVAESADEPSSGFELALPPDLDPAAVAPVGEESPAPDALDGWSRSRPAVAPAPAPRPRSERPAPALDEESTESLRLVSARSRAPLAGAPDLAAEMNDRFALGDFTGALRAAELVLGQRPDDPEAAQVAAVSRERLVSFHLARVGGRRAVLGRRVDGAELRWLGLDHRAGFLLSMVDGTTTVEEIVDLSGMPEHEALRLLAELIDGGTVMRLG
jgi:hypothetical protein